jgi:hypothetical protein
VTAASFTDAAGVHGPDRDAHPRWPHGVASASFAGLIPTAFPLLVVLTRQPAHPPPDRLFEGTLAFFTVMTCRSLWAERTKALRLGPGALALRTGLRVGGLGVHRRGGVHRGALRGSRMVTRWTRDGKTHRGGPAGRTRGLVRESFDRDWHTVGSWWLIPWASTGA